MRYCGTTRGRRLTPITNTSCLFRAGIEHGGDDQESRGDSTFTDTEEKAYGKKGAKRGASRVAAEDDCPAEDVDAWRAVSGAGEREDAEYLIHLPTGKRWRARF